MQSFFVTAPDGCRLHAVREGDGPPIILCHGFPDYWGGWAAQIASLSRDHTVIAADGRGCNESDKPADVASYALSILVEDIEALIEACEGRRPLLVGHDWGGAVAWAYACRHPEKLAGLAVLSAPHPAILQEALWDDPRQREASAYMPRLRAPQAETAFRADDWALMRGMLARLRSMGLSDDEDEARYIEAWTRPGALTGALNWYRANPADEGPTFPPPKALGIPTLLMWGSDDSALLPSLAERHRRFVSDLEIDIVEGAGHWLQRERADHVSDRLRAFARRTVEADGRRLGTID
jgi:pimeloyl-ACP methyl ester carboxylesterase